MMGAGCLAGWKSPGRTTTPGDWVAGKSTGTFPVKLTLSKLPMIELFHRDAGRPDWLGRPPGRHDRTARRSLENRDIASIDPFFRGPFPREGVRRGASLEPMEEPSWFGTIRSATQSAVRITTWRRKTNRPPALPERWFESRIDPSATTGRSSSVCRVRARATITWKETRHGSCPRCRLGPGGRRRAGGYVPPRRTPSRSPATSPPTSR